GNYESAMHTLYEGAILAVIVVFLFLRDWRATIIAALTLPLSIFPAFWVMELLGFSLNMVTLLAITLSTGILVDDAIVEIENIVRHIRMGKSPYQAALEAADEIGLAVIAISLAIVAVFIPASFMPSVPGQFFKQFGITVSVQVLFSLLCARMITPMLAAYFLRPHQHEEKGDGPTMRLYTRLVTGAVRYRFITVVLGRRNLAAERLSARHGYGPLDARHRAASRFAAFGHGVGDRYHRQSGAQAARGGERLRRRRTNSKRRRRCRPGRIDHQLRAEIEAVALPAATRAGDRPRPRGHSGHPLLVRRRQWTAKRQVHRHRPGQRHGGECRVRACRSNAPAPDCGERRLRSDAQSPGAEDLSAPRLGGTSGRVNRESVGNDPGSDDRRCRP